MTILLADQPAIYVGTYAKYNAGSIKGAWLQLEDYSAADEFYAAARALHADESDPEFMFQDWQSMPTGMVSESHIAPELWDWLELDDDDRELLSVYRGNIDQSGTIEQAREAYHGRHDSKQAFAEEWHDETGDAPPEKWAYYIDWEAVARDMEHNGVNFVHHDGSYWVFVS